MKIKRILYTEPFTSDNIPLWHCPTCHIGLLKTESGNLQIEESFASKENHKNPEWEPNWIQGSFAGKLICNNTHCKEVVFITGKMKVDEQKDYNNKEGVWEFYTIENLYPLIFKPTLNLFKIDEDIPLNIHDAIEKAFVLFWVDEASCANKIRTVVELIMDERKVLKTYMQNGKRKQYTLHRRIELFKLLNSDAADCLMAVKWIGNSGSHANDSLGKEDLLDGLDMLQYVTYKLYEKDSIRIKSIAKRINKFRGPSRKK